MSTASTPPPSPPAPPATKSGVAPERLGAYELLIDLASGGMATVCLARATDFRTGPPLVAVKKPHRHLMTDKTLLTMLVDEARLASAIDHPNVVKVRELGFEAGVPFIVMDYIEGASLAELRRELSAAGRALDVRVATRIALDALAGLHAAHELTDDNGKRLHIIHRDVSPHNVLIGCNGCSHLTDFGIAKAEDRVQTTRTHEVKGKLAYLAPERVDKRRACTVQSDVFSMAVVLWECFAGRRLFRGEEAVDVLQEVMSGPIPTLRQIGAQIPVRLDEAIARALSRDLEIRFPTAQAFAQAIVNAVGNDQIGGRADVARLMEAIFGERMALRQEQVRATIGSNEIAALLRESGLPARERTSLVEPPLTGPALFDLAPPAPTGRYALGAEMKGHASGSRSRVPWWSAVAVGSGIAIGAMATLAVVARRARSTYAAVPVSPPAANLVSEAPATPRRVVLSLPFLATHVTLDDLGRDLDPATDVATFDVSAESGTRHRVTAKAADGTRAEGYVSERDGIARPEGEGLTVSVPPESRHEGPRAGSHPHPIGTVHDGFTKLK